ncbi:MAG: hypothetical protein M3220_22110 [Chloroflexota bacterium]|nr:hypothetical protein [Chloroflexota bacterium]
MNDIQASDDVLLGGIACRDPVALEVLYDRHAHWVYQVILRIVRDEDSAEAILIDSFWQVWQQGDELQRQGTVRACLLRIARNRSVAHLRRQTTGSNPLWQQLPE